MKILYVVRGLNQSSGTTHAIVPCSEEMARRGHEVSLYAVQKPAGTEELLPDGGLVHTSLFDMSLPLNNPGISFSYAKAIRVAVAEFDVVHIQAVRNYVTWQTMKACADTGVPCVVAPQGSFNEWVLNCRSLFHRMYDSRVELPLLRRASAIQCLTDREVEEVKAVGITAPCKVIPNGMVIPEKQAVRARGDKKTLLYMGRLNRKKGLDILIDAFAVVTKRLPEVRLIIAGSDGGSGYGESVRVMAENAGLLKDGRVKFAGEVFGAEKEKLFAESDAFVLTSYSEGLPLAILEALARGLPAVITDQCNVPEVGAHGAGMVCHANVKSAADSLYELLSDHERLGVCGKAARRLAENHFSWERITERLESLYRELGEK